MKHNGYVIFQKYIKYEMGNIKKEYDIIKRNSYDIYQLLYKTRYVNEVDITKITPKWINPEALPMYNITKVDELPIDASYKNLIKIILNNEPKLKKLKAKYKVLLPYKKLCMTMYVNLLSLYWTEIQKILLKGYKVSLGYGLGSFQIIRKMSKGKGVDWVSSMNHKRIILLRGLKPYNYLTGKGIKWLIYKPKAINMILRWRAGSYIKYKNKYKYTCSSLLAFDDIDNKVLDISKWSVNRILNSYTITMMVKCLALAIKDPKFRDNFEYVEYESKTIPKK